MRRYKLLILGLIAFLVGTRFAVQADEPAGSRFEFHRVESIAKDATFLTSLDGQFRVRSDGAKLQLWSVKTQDVVGQPLLKVEEHVKIFCWTFSHESKTLAVGTGYREDKTNVGSIFVFDVAAGEKVAEYLAGESRVGKFGAVRSLAFSKDDKVIHYTADPFSLDGK